MTTTTDNDRVNIEQSASGRLEGRVLQYSMIFHHRIPNSSSCTALLVRQKNRDPVHCSDISETGNGAWASHSFNALPERVIFETPVVMDDGPMMIMTIYEGENGYRGQILDFKKGKS